MTLLHVDFETYSACDLKARGLDVYARDLTTGVWCMAYAFDDEPVEIWIAGQVCPPRVVKHVLAGGLVYAHNANFEILLWNCVLAKRRGWPTLHVEQVRCTMVMAYAMALPGALEKAAPALGIPERKDSAGKRVMMLLCRPQANGEFLTPATAPDKFKLLYDYCKQDVEVERALHHRMMELSPSEQRLWELDHRVNQNGILVDLPAIGKALTLVAKEKERLDGEMLRVTGGVVGACTEVALLSKWIRSQGVKVTGLAKADVLDTLSLDELPPVVKQALLLRQEAAKSSTAKLVAMKDRVCPDGRVRGIHQFHGANTGRWAGRGVQTQNLPRTRPGVGPQDVEKILANLGNRAYIDAFYGPVLDALADSVRGMIVAPAGKELLAVDFSAVEARVLAWLAGEESVLEIFRTHGKIYEHAAAGIYHVPMEQVDKHQRQIGKVAVLALGYGGGIGAFQSMAKNYNIKVPDAEADEIKRLWRTAHPAITQYWYQLDRTVKSAIAQGGKWSVGARGRQVTLKKNGSFLWAQLPSGRVLCYPYAEINTGYDMELPQPGLPPKRKKAHPSEREVYEAKHYVVTEIREDCIWYMSVNGTTNKWEWADLYGGSLAENFTQAVARDLLAEGMLRLDQRGAKIVAHVHDEAVLEVEPGTDVKQVEALFAEVPVWAAGLPLAAEGWRGPRYRK
jgi:DNA polymerase